MDIIDFELARYDEWKEDMEKRKRHFESSTGLLIFPVCNADNNDKKYKVIDDLWNTEGPVDFEIKRRSLDSTMEVTDNDIKKFKEDFEKSRKKFKSLTKKQEQLLRGNKIN